MYELRTDNHSLYLIEFSQLREFVSHWGCQNKCQEASSREILQEAISYCFCGSVSSFPEEILIYSYTLLMLKLNINVGTVHGNADALHPHLF